MPFKIFENEYSPNEHLKLLLAGYPILFKGRKPVKFMERLAHELLLKHLEKDINRLTREINPKPIYNDNSNIEEFKRNNPVYETIEKYIDINSRGFARCPFHANGKERTPSLKVYEDSWHCFACGEGNDVLDFVMKINNKTLFELLKIK